VKTAILALEFVGQKMKETTYSIKYKIKKSTTPDIRKALYTGMLYPRMIEEKMLKLLRQGAISKWFSGIGQEAISVGTTMAMQEDDLIFPLNVVTDADRELAARIDRIVA
jgi:2-oxoisovalerate dehydrogenase E1 component